MKKKPFDDFITLAFIIISVGIIIIIAGIYFETNAMTSSGVTMGRYGLPYGTGTIDGSGMVFCGLIILGAGFILRDNETPSNDADTKS